MSNALMIVPTYQRLGNVVRQLQALVDTDTTIDVLYACDSDDPDLSVVVAACVAVSFVGYVVTPGRSGMLTKLNAAAVHNAGSYRYIGFMGDDHLPRTRHWDRDLCTAIDALGEPGVAYPNDLLQGENMPTAVLLSAGIVTELGYMAPPVLAHMYCDNFWLDLGHGLGAATYLPDTIVEHMHFSVGKSVLDASYQHSNHPDVYANDKANYERYRRDELPAVVARLRGTP